MSTDQFPLVSIVMPAYNREHWIGQAIASALGQDYPNLEIIINDDWSTDNTPAVVQTFLHDKRIRFSRNEKNLGIALNYHRSFIELAKGEFLMNLGSDDYLENPSFISNAIRLAQQHDNIGLIFGKPSLYFEDTGKTVPFDSEKEKIFFKSEFNKGMDIFFLPPFITRGWAGCLMNARIMRENNIHFSDIKLCDDARINFLLMTCSNVICTNQPCYVVRNHPENLGKVRPSDLLIHDVLMMLEEVYQFALAKQPDLQKELQTWKMENLTYHIEYNMGYLKVSDKTEFRKFSNYIREHYPDIYRKYINSKKFLYLKYAYKPIVMPLKKIISGRG